MGLGITFMPNAENMPSGSGVRPGAGGGAGNNLDLSQAYKILSLRLPRVLGSGAITPLGSTGSNTDSLKGSNPMSAVFVALLQSLVNGGGQGPIDTTGLGPTTAGSGGSIPTPGIVYKDNRPTSPPRPPALPTDGGWRDPVEEPKGGREY